jgi:hypothetical protein
MNCKPGDLAVMIRATVPENVGAICAVLVSSTYTEVLGEQVWVVEHQRPRASIHYETGERLCEVTANVRDSWLRPIRPDEGEDEMIRIAGKPEGVPA